jgi:hypothetical protein
LASEHQTDPPEDTSGYARFEVPTMVLIKIRGLRDVMPC